MTWSRLEETVERYSQHGTLGVSVLGPQGDTWSHNGDRGFRAASTVKIPVMVEIYRQIERGERNLEDVHTLLEDEKARGSGVMAHLHAGLELTLRDLVYLMISISDNTATNILIRYATMDRVNATMADLGMVNSNLSREMKGRPLEAGEEENWAAPNDYVAAVRAIVERTAATPASCELMQAMLEKQQNPRRIARHLPRDESITWGSKTGTSLNVANDSGFITTPSGTLYVAVYCEDLPDQHTAEQAIGDIARAALQDAGMLE